MEAIHLESDLLRPSMSEVIGHASPVTQRIPKKREKRARRASMIICFLIGICSLAFYLAIGVLYEEPKFSSLFSATLGLFSIVLGTLVDRCCLIVEERHHLWTRYGGSILKMVKACFGGIKKGPVVSLLILTSIIVVVVIASTDMQVDHWSQAAKYAVYILSGIGVGPLIMQLLSLNAESEVHISTLLEERETCVGNILAWSYYYNYLAKVLPLFAESFGDNPVQDGGQHTRPVKLDLSKLILLISHNCYIKDNLHDLDDKVEKLKDINKDEWKFPVYSLTDNAGRKYNYVVHYAKEPLETLRHLTHRKEKSENDCEYQVQLFYRTLSDILKNPPNGECLEKCILVPIRAEPAGRLRHGTLAQLLRKEVEKDDSMNPPDREEGDRFIKVMKPGPKNPDVSKTAEKSYERAGTSKRDIVDLPAKEREVQREKSCSENNDFELPRGKSRLHSTLMESQPLLDDTDKGEIRVDVHDDESKSTRVEKTKESDQEDAQSSLQVASGAYVETSGHSMNEDPTHHEKAEIDRKAGRSNASLKAHRTDPGEIYPEKEEQKDPRREEAYEMKPVKSDRVKTSEISENYSTDEEDSSVPFTSFCPTGSEGSLEISHDSSNENETHVSHIEKL